MNWPSAVCCAGCGRELGLAPSGTSSETKCPPCSLPLTAVRGARGTLLDCGQCGGQFVEHALLRDLLDLRERIARSSGLLRQPRREKLVLGPVRYFGCPQCAEMMNRKNFGGTSGVVVDVCPRHGTWFENGELPAVLAFVESGGTVQPAPQKPLASPAPAIMLSSGAGSGLQGTTSPNEAVEWVGELLVFLYELLD